MPAPPSTPFTDIGTLAASLASRSSTLPIDLESLATAEGISHLYAPFREEFDGLLLHDRGKFTLLCNTRRHPRGSVRSRFTFAHELAHYFIPEHREVLCSGQQAARIPRHGPWGDRFMEQEADLFAANLLMPDIHFRRLAGATPGLPRIRSLAESFGTSLTATAYRALELDLFPAPAAVLLWGQLGQPSGRRVSPDTAALGREYLVLATMPPVDSVTACSVEELSSGYHHGECHLMDWFIDLSGYEPDHQIPLREEVMSLGNYGWITLLQPQC